MDDTAKYLIHASIAADGVVERSDVVGAVFGQTEGLLGDELDLRDLQQSSKVGRIDVQIDSENGQSFGRITIASSLDKVETAILAASLETIDRVGPCQASVEVTNIEDVREAKRRQVIDRAKELLAGSFDESVMDSSKILEEVRESVRIEDITEYHGLPAGPRVADSDAIIVVEGRADVLTLLQYGIKNAVAVEGTNVPDPIADLTEDRTVTAFLDGDRGGELILRELAQVGDVDYVVFAPEGRSVEDLARHEVMSALRDKTPYGDLFADDEGPAMSPAADAVDEESTVTETTPPTAAVSVGDAGVTPEASTTVGTVGSTDDEADAPPEPDDAADETADVDADADADDDTDADAATDDTPSTLRGHVRAIVDAETESARLLDADFEPIETVPAGEAFDAISEADPAPYALVLDGQLTQRILDVAAQRGVEQIVARSAGEMVKTPVDVRVRTIDQFATAD
ncbi:DNA primase DnaG [Haloplanus aerogenes]|uniref:DNA primase DnaG n=1 Tax=Haloplanus aerogenes TaxID=660522 RepID=A0A3M0CU13_9EURY|nr:DNA primase DnaG [Haloplanus aerogenes]AZH26642.1 DNA primase [Haloplanus aerogenes]RMB12878.1 DNA primase [Haloplanus aerogenes]